MLLLLVLSTVRVKKTTNKRQDWFFDIHTHTDTFLYVRRIYYSLITSSIMRFKCWLFLFFSSRSLSLLPQCLWFIRFLTAHIHTQTLAHTKSRTNERFVFDKNKTNTALDCLLYVLCLQHSISIVRLSCLLVHARVCVSKFSMHACVLVLGNMLHKLWQR